MHSKIHGIWTRGPYLCALEVSPPTSKYWPSQKKKNGYYKKKWLYLWNYLAFKGLNEDPYTWWHNDVCRVLRNAIIPKVSSVNKTTKKVQFLAFIFYSKKGFTNKTCHRYLTWSNAWIFFFDLLELKVFSIIHFS